MVRVPVADPRLWSPESPALYELEVRLESPTPGSPGDRVRLRAAFRRIEAFGPELRLNGRPLSVRGLLNWGYAPPSNAPTLDEEATVAAAAGEGKPLNQSWLASLAASTLNRASRSKVQVMNSAAMTHRSRAG